MTKRYTIRICQTKYGFRYTIINLDGQQEYRGEAYSYLACKNVAEAKAKALASAELAKSKYINEEYEFDTGVRTD